MKNFYVYILASKSRVLYTGMTNDLMRRMYEHRENVNAGFTQKYKVKTLVYFEMTNGPTSAIQREKQIKGWSRSKKIELVEAKNSDWKDLSEEWFKKRDSSSRKDYSSE
jgi:putative endonuclease